MAVRLAAIRERRLSLAVGCLVSLVCPGAWADAAFERCAPTPPQTEGPYHPVESDQEPIQRSSSDLTRVEGRAGEAEGQTIRLEGRVLDEHCRPVAGAVVEIWQASARGRYNHPRDRGNPAPLDPAFRYWVKVQADRDGRYRIKTILPGRYQAGHGWIRPSHVHFKVHYADGRTLTTQLYFDGDPYLEQDYIFQDVPIAERRRVVARSEPPEPGKEREGRLYRFDLVVPVTGP